MYFRSGVRIKHQARTAPGLAFLNQAIAPKADRTLDTQGLLPLTSLNTVVCLNKEDLSQLVQWRTSSLPASMLSKATVDPQLSHQDNTQISKWVMEALPALVAMVVVANKLLILNGALLRHNKASETASVVIKANFSIASKRCTSPGVHDIC